MQQSTRRVCERLAVDRRIAQLCWQCGGAQPPRALVTQASSVCFTSDGFIVLAAGADQAPALPGGHPQPGEPIEQAFVREVAEEACAVVTALAYLGAVEVRDPAAPTGPQHYFQVRFWARVELLPWQPRFETTERLEVPPCQLVTTLGWTTTRLAHSLLAAALTVERGRRTAL